MRLSNFIVQAVCGALFSSGLAQDSRVSIVPRESFKPAPGKMNERTASIRVNSDLVLVPVLVTDRADRLVKDLRKSDFKVYDDNIEQEISHFVSEDAPLSVCLVFDASGSMRNKLQRSRMAVREFLKVSNPEDEFSLITFNDRVRAIVGFTRESSGIENASLLSKLADS